MTSLVFVTPAYGRLDLSAVCFAHRAWAIEELRAYGVAASCVVVADDENLDLAREHGFETVEQENEPLGRKFNDGYEYAARMGADFIVPMGSDSWIDPDYFRDLPDEGILTSRYYAVVNEPGVKLARLEIAVDGGVGPHVLPTALLAPATYRPVEESRARGCDGSLLRTLGRFAPLRFVHRDLHDLQYVGFRTADLQLTPYRALVAAYEVTETLDVWDELLALAPADLVEQAREVYVARRRSASGAPSPSLLKLRS